MKRIIMVLFGGLALASCAYRNTTEETRKFAEQLVSDPFDLTGDFHWKFQLMGGTQHSVHTFYPDSITYSMDGRVYSTDYTMQKLSYDQSINKWIGEDEDSIVYVLFFRDLTDTTLTLYKRKCSSEGLAEAIEFELPPPDATEDHGWNVYARSARDEADRLPVVGSYSTPTESLVLSDSLVVFNDQSFTRLSYHAGERRWVGQADSTFLQIFFQEFSDSTQLRMSVTEFNNLEQAYLTKYSTVDFRKYARE
ncbi:MAG: hypothetical protein AAF632_14100 [Bacteroidota bacterium]